MTEPSPEHGRPNTLPPGNVTSSETLLYGSQVPGHDPRLLLEIDRLLLQVVTPPKKASASCN